MTPKFKPGDKVISILDLPKDRLVTIKYPGLRDSYLTEYRYWISYPDGTYNSSIKESHLRPLDTPDIIFKDLLLT